MMKVFSLQDMMGHSIWYIEICLEKMIAWTIPFPWVLNVEVACPGLDAAMTPALSDIWIPEPKPSKGSAIYCPWSWSMTTGWFPDDCSSKPINALYRQQHTLTTNSLPIANWTCSWTLGHDHDINLDWIDILTGTNWWVQWYPLASYSTL